LRVNRFLFLTAHRFNQFSWADCSESTDSFSNMVTDSSSSSQRWRRRYVKQQIVITEIRLMMSRDDSRLTTEKAAYRPNHSLVIATAATLTEETRSDSVAKIPSRWEAVGLRPWRRRGESPRAGRYPTVISTEKVRPICVVASFFVGILALLARSVAGFGLQTAPVALLREALARWPPWDPPSKRPALGSAMALGFGRPTASTFPAVSCLLPD
jgi:hypothetical protein